MTDRWQEGSRWEGPSGQARAQIGEEWKHHQAASVRLRRNLERCARFAMGRETANDVATVYRHGRFRSYLRARPWWKKVWSYIWGGL